jgi:hypothetical protein
LPKYLVGALLAVSASVALSVTALAAPPGHLTPFAAGGATVGWTSRHQALVLTEPASGSAYAGAQLKGISGEAPLSPPSFVEWSNLNENSGGSPRLVMQFSDGGTIILYNTAMTTSRAPASQWDSSGGHAGYLYNTSYSNAVADHSGATVTGVWVVTDSGWEGYGYTNWVSDLQYGGQYFTQPPQS